MPARPGSAEVDTSDRAMSDRTITITRLLNAPRELVFEAWTDPKHTDHWMGPEGYITRTKSMDARPGGRWCFVMSGPQGEFPSRVTYIEVVKPSRLVYMHGSDIDNDPEAFHVTVTFEDLGDKTHITMHSVLPTAEQRNKVIREYRAIEGGYQTLARLEERLRVMATR
jgi:uncharacterized protein YndB with AHSA1/START domain